MQVSWRWIQHLPRAAQQYPKGTAAVGVGAVLLGYLYLAPEKPRAVPTTQAEVRLDPSVTKRTTLEGQMGETLQRLDTAETTNRELTKTLKTLQQGLQDERDTRAREKAEDEVRRGQEQKQREDDLARATRERQHATATKAAVRPQGGTPPASQAPATKPFELRMVKGKDTPSAAPRIPPRLHQDETAYLGEGSVAQARVMTGVLASARGAPSAPGSEGDTAVLLSITGLFDSAWMLHGPGRDPEPTAVPIQGCRMFGWARADLSSGRVYIHLYLLVCVMPDKTTYPVKIRGYVTDADGTNGLVGRLETRDSAMIAKAAALAVMQEAAALVGLAKSSVVVTSNAGAYQQMGTGVQSSIQQVTQYFLENARLLGPVLWVESGAKAQVVLLDGVTLEGFPTMVTLQGGQP